MSTSPIEHDNHAATVDLREYIATLKARRWTILLMTVLVTGLAIGFSVMQTPQYTATARVLVEIPLLETGMPQLVNLETERQLVDSQAVAALASEELGVGNDVETLLDGLTITSPPEAEVLEIAYTSDDPAFARDAANAFADAYIAFKRNRQTTSLTAEQEAIEERIDNAEAQLAQITEDLEVAEAGTNDALLVTLENNRTSLIARIGVLQQQLDDLQSSRPDRVAVGEVIEIAALPTNPSSPKYVSNTLLALFLGLALGIGLAFLRERLDDRFRGRSDVEKLTGAPVLATVPRFRPEKKSDTPTLVAANRPKGTTSEAYRSLRTNLLFITGTENAKTILVTSAQAGEGKTVTAANLAIVLAQAGHRVILVSGDLRRPTLEKQFGIDREPGLSSWLANDGVDLWGLIRDPGIPNLRILPCGPVPPNPAELLTSSRFDGLLRLLEENADYVLLDSAPVLAVADSSIISTRVGVTLVVIDASSTHRTAVQHAVTELHRVGGRIAGTVLNSLDSTGSPYYYGPYVYEYAGEEGPAAKNGGDTDKTSRRRGLLRRRS
jgi:non-specific protein-tyrosine kinase